MQPPPPPPPQGGQCADRFRLAERERSSRVRFQREVVDLGISTTTARSLLPLVSVERPSHRPPAHLDGTLAAGTAALEDAEGGTRTPQEVVQEASEIAIGLVELALRKMGVGRASAATYRATGAMSDLPDALPEGDPVDLLKRALQGVFTISAAHASAFAVLDRYIESQFAADHLLQVSVYPPTTARTVLARHRLAAYLHIDGALRHLRSAVSRLQAAADSAGVALALPLSCAACDTCFRDYDCQMCRAFYQAAMASVSLASVRQEAEAALSYARILLHTD
jgi:hypothetical protein